MFKLLSFRIIRDHGLINLRKFQSKTSFFKFMLLCIILTKCSCHLLSSIYMMISMWGNVQKYLPQDNSPWPPITWAICVKCLQWMPEILRSQINTDPRAVFACYDCSPMNSLAWNEHFECNDKGDCIFRAFIDPGPLGTVSFLSVNRSPSLTISHWTLRSASWFR